MKQLLIRLFRKLGYDVKKIPSAGPDLAMYRRLYSEDSLRHRRFYNIGAGSFSHPYWTNVDYDTEWYSTNRKYTLSGIQYDLMSMEPIPVADGSAELVYTSHTVEHIPDAAAANMFREAYRMLKPGGIFRVTTPNIDLEYRAYRDNDRDYFYWAENYSRPSEMERIGIHTPMNRASVAQIFLAHFATAVSEIVKDGEKERISDAQLESLFAELGFEGALNYCSSRCPVEHQQKYPGHHMNWWNFTKAERMLREAGFSSIFSSGYGQSFAPPLRNIRHFDSTNPKVSLYVEAVK